MVFDENPKIIKLPSLNRNGSLVPYTIGSILDKGELLSVGKKAPENFHHLQKCEIGELFELWRNAPIQLIPMQIPEERNYLTRVSKLILEQYL